MDRNLIFCQRLFSERALETAVKLGTRQCLFFGADHNMFAYRKPHWAEGVRVFELCSREDICRKLMRLEQKNVAIPAGTYFMEWEAESSSWKECLQACSAFESGKLIFCDLMGLTRTMTKVQFAELLRKLEPIMAKGSSVVFDYRDDSGVAFLDGYSYREMERLLSECGFHIYEHVSAGEMWEQYLRMHRILHGNEIVPPPDVNYCLAVKKVK